MNPENYKLKTIKNHIKTLGENIRVLKQLRKTKRCNLSKLNPDIVKRVRAIIDKRLDDLKFWTQPLHEEWVIDEQLYRARWDVRHHHIAYCEFKGTERKLIENNPEVKASELTIKKIKDNMNKDNLKVN